MAGLIVAHGVSFITFPPPLYGDALQWFAFFGTNRLAGLLGFESLLVLYVLLSIPLSVVLFLELRSRDPLLMVLFLVVSLTGSVLFVLSRPVLEMLDLSTRYAEASSDLERNALLAAGNVFVAAFHGTAFHASYLLGVLSGVLLAAAMLGSRAFAHRIACLRLGSSLFDLGIYIPGIGMYLSLVSVSLLLAFHLLLGIALISSRKRRHRTDSNSP